MTNIHTTRNDSNERPNLVPVDAILVGESFREWHIDHGMYGPTRTVTEIDSSYAGWTRLECGHMFALSMMNAGRVAVI